MNQNHTMMQLFEWNLPANADHWNWTASMAKSLKAAGIDTVWLPPAYKGASGINDVGYGVYDTYDLGEFDQKGSIPTKYGTRTQYLKAVQALQSEGISVLADIVLNHRMGADECETVTARECRENDRLKIFTGEEQVSVWTKFTFPGRKGKYSDFTWNWKHFDGTDWDQKAQRKSVFLFQGKAWDEHTDKEHVNYDYLMGADLDMGNPEILQHLTDWGKWYLDTVGMDGFRLDAVKHIRTDFFRDWLSAMRSYSGKELFSVGEYWSPHLNSLQNYLRETHGCMSLFDVPLHFRFYQISHADGHFPLNQLFSDTLVGTDPTKAVTFVDNHDTQPGQALSSYVAPWFKPLAYAAILLREAGFPCVFFGDYFGLTDGSGKKVEMLPLLLRLRSDFSYGIQHDYLDDENLIGWTREGDNEHPSSGLAVVMTDSQEGRKTMYIGQKFAGSSFFDCTGQCSESIQINPDGTGTFAVKGGSVSVWVSKEAFEKLCG